MSWDKNFPNKVNPIGTDLEQIKANFVALEADGGPDKIKDAVDKKHA